MNLQFSSEVIHSNVQFVYLKVEKVIKRNADRVILTKSIHNIYVGLVKHMNVISLKRWILATVVNFNRQIQGLLFSFDCQLLALHCLRHQFHVVFCMFAFLYLQCFFQGIKLDVVFCWGPSGPVVWEKAFWKGQTGGNLDVGGVENAKVRDRRAGGIWLREPHKVRNLNIGLCDY